MCKSCFCGPLACSLLAHTLADQLLVASLSTTDVRALLAGCTGKVWVNILEADRDNEVDGHGPCETRTTLMTPSSTGRASASSTAADTLLTLSNADDTHAAVAVHVAERTGAPAWVGAGVVQNKRAGASLCTTTASRWETGRSARCFSAQLPWPAARFAWR